MPQDRPAFSAGIGRAGGIASLALTVQVPLAVARIRLEERAFRAAQERRYQDAMRGSARLAPGLW